MIENAFYQCNPPERTAVSTKVRSPTESYIRRLVYYELSKATADKVVRLLRKLDWESSEVVRVVEKVLFKVWKVRFSNVHLLAVIVADLSLYHPHISVKVVDGILEEIRLGLEVCSAGVCTEQG